VEYDIKDLKITESNKDCKKIDNPDWDPNECYYAYDSTLFYPSPAINSEFECVLIFKFAKSGWIHMLDKDDNEIDVSSQLENELFNRLSFGRKSRDMTDNRYVKKNKNNLNLLFSKNSDFTHRQICVRGSKNEVCQLIKWLVPDITSEKNIWNQFLFAVDSENNKLLNENVDIVYLEKIGDRNDDSLCSTITKKIKDEFNPDNANDVPNKEEKKQILRDFGIFKDFGNFTSVVNDIFKVKTGFDPTAIQNNDLEICMIQPFNANIINSFL